MTTPPQDNQTPDLVTQFHQANKRRGLPSILAIIAFMLVATVFVMLTTPTNLQVDKMGIHLLLDDGRNQWDESLWPQHMEHAAQVGRYVTQLIRYDDRDVAKWQRFLDLCQEHGLTPILRLATTWDFNEGYWLAPLPDTDGRYSTVAQAWADFFNDLDWSGEPRIVVIGNEPNHGGEWGGTPDPAAYARYLSDVGEAINSVSPSMWIANAPLDYYAPNTNGQPFDDGMVYLDGESFLDGMFNAEPDAFDVIDVWASHAYAFDAPWEGTYAVDYLQGATNSHAIGDAGRHNRGVNSYDWELTKLARLGLTRYLPVIITETGWRHDQNDPETVALYTDLAYRGNNGRYADLPETGWTPWLHDEQVIAVTPFALAGAPDEWDAFNWVETDADGQILGKRLIFDTVSEIFQPNSASD